jgi:pimeloyl-ACP methyl ester carboxylesterase
MDPRRRRTIDALLGAGEELFAQRPVEDVTVATPTAGWRKYPIDARAMNSYIRPVLARREIRWDGRKAIGSVSARHTRAAAQRLAGDFRKPVLLAWASEDHVFPLDHAQRYARTLGAQLHLVDDSYTYLSEDQPERTADLLRSALEH